MKKFFVNLLCCFVPVRKWRHRLRHKCWGKGANVSASLQDMDATDRSANHIWIIALDGTRRSVKSVPNCIFKFSGRNNNVFLYEPIGKLKLNVDVTSNVSITIHPVGWNAEFRVYKGGVGEEFENNLIVGRGFSSTLCINVEFTSGGGGDVIIGDDCMFAFNITIRTGDFHTIVERGTCKVLNYNADVVFGNHVWVASDVLICKNVRIADNSVVGARSVVTRHFDEPNVIIAGVPAKIVKRNINWDRRCISEYEYCKQ